jgi:hypothetical protein
VCERTGSMEVWETPGLWVPENMAPLLPEIMRQGSPELTV